MAMSGQVRHSLALTLAGLLAGLGLVAALFGGPSLRRLTGRHGAEPPAVSAPAPDGSPRDRAGPGTLAGRTDPTIDFRDDRTGPPRSGTAQPGAAAPPAPTPRSAEAGRPAAGPDAAEAPRFDIVRVEPNGDAVVAGRGAPHAVVEMLVDGKSVAKATADASGQFAIVPRRCPRAPARSGCA
ncbi:hypothetical protein ACU4GR_16190 [Methylobacterium oryzae CBMB20]